MLKKLVAITLIAGLLLVMPTNDSQAQLSCDEQIALGVALAQIHGHIWAIESNIDQSIEPQFAHSAQSHVPTHASHPLSEIHPDIAPLIGDDDAQSIKEILETLFSSAADPDSAALQSAIADAKSVVDNLKHEKLDLLGDPSLDTAIILSLVTLSHDEYDEAIINGELVLDVELQDAYAFQAISKQMVQDLSSMYDPSTLNQINQLYDQIDVVYGNRQSPEISEELTVSLVAKILEINTSGSMACDYLNVQSEVMVRELGENEISRVLEYTANIRMLLGEAKAVYAADSFTALELVEEAYISNFEFIEDDLETAGQGELMEKVEHAMREDLIGAIRANNPAVPQMIDDILVDLDLVEQVIPEFGPITLAILVVAIASIVVIGTRTRLYSSMRSV